MARAKVWVEGREIAGFTVIDRQTNGKLVNLRCRNCGTERAGHISNLCGGVFPPCVVCEPERRRGRRPSPLGHPGLLALLSNYKRRATKKGLAFELTVEQFKTLVESGCRYCGTTPSQIIFKYSYNGVDRKDPKLGYTVNNCVGSCGVCNLAKRSLTEPEFLAWIARVYAHTK